jgi:hypothetical protein
LLYRLLGFDATSPEAFYHYSDLGANEQRCFGCRKVSTRGALVSLLLNNDAEQADPDAGTESVQRKRRQWLALGLSVVGLLLVGALIAGVIYAVTIDRAFTDNLQHSNQLPPEVPTDS